MCLKAWEWIILSHLLSISSLEEQQPGSSLFISYSFWLGPVLCYFYNLNVKQMFFTVISHSQRTFRTLYWEMFWENVFSSWCNVCKQWLLMLWICSKKLWSSLSCLFCPFIFTISCFVHVYIGTILKQPQLFLLKLHQKEHGHHTDKNKIEHWMESR